MKLRRSEAKLQIRAKCLALGSTELALHRRPLPERLQPHRELVRAVEKASDPIVIPVLVAFGALSAYLLVVAPLALPFVRRRDGEAVGLRMLFPRLGLDDESPPAC